MTLDRPRFTTTKLVEGYDMGEVDNAVDRVFAALEHPGPTAMTATDAAHIRFTPVRMRQGYAMGDVDNWLDLAAAELARAQGTDLPNSPPSLAHQVAARSEEPAAESGAITEIKAGGPGLAMILVGILMVVAVVVYALFF